MKDRETRQLLHLQNITRWVVVPTIGNQSVADHSFNVAVLARKLCDFHKNRLSDGFRLKVLEYALEHDIEEAVFGDNPSTAKISPEYKSYARDHGEVRALVKMADILEALVYARRQVMMGNTVFQTGGVIDQLHNKLYAIRMGIEWDKPYGEKSWEANARIENFIDRMLMDYPLPSMEYDYLAL